MRTFTALFIATLALTANAGIVNKRSTSDCVDHVSILNDQLEGVQADYALYSENGMKESSTSRSTEEIEEANKEIRDDVKALLNDLKPAVSKCCVSSEVATSETESRAISDALTTYSDTVGHLLLSFEGKRSAFNETQIDSDATVVALRELYLTNSELKSCVEGKLLSV
ncbi:unnamed protein product [Mucor hiemalis]